MAREEDGRMGRGPASPVHQDGSADPIRGGSRREFLARSAAMAAAAGAWSAIDADDLLADTAPVGRALQPPLVGAFEPVRMAVIGTGGMGTEHCRAFMRFVDDGREDVRITALCDVCDSRLENARSRVAETQSEPPVTTRNYHEVLADPTLHGVLIATPEHWHAKIAEDAIMAGKAVYLEKPMTLRLKNALRLRKVVQSASWDMLQVGTQYTMIPSYIEAKRIIAEGTIGKPVSSQTSYCRNSKDGEWLYYEIDPEWQPGVNLDWREWCGPLGRQDWDPQVYARWRRYRKYSTGIMGDLLVHRMAPLIQALDVGWPVRVTASGGHYVDKAMENHDQINLTIEFEGEHTMIVAGSTANELGLETVIRGHRANLYVGGRDTVMRPERLYVEELEETTIEGPDYGNPQDLLRLDWLNVIRTRKAPASDVHLGTKVMVIVDLATRSMWEGGAFSYDPRRQKVKKL
jgi:predicted dehydrogenase